MIKTYRPKQGLKERLVDFLASHPRELLQIYRKFKNIKPSTIRGRLNENVNRDFKRIAKGVYVSVKGKSKALLMEGDSWKVLKEIADESMDVIICDSPYTILNKYMAMGTTRKLLGEWSFKTRDLDLQILSEFFRVLKPGGHFFTFLPSDTKQTLEFNKEQISIGEEIGFVFNKRFIWDKQVKGMGYNGRNRYEQIIFFSKGPRRMPQDRSIPDLLSYKRISPKQRRHETEKPLELIEDLIKFSTKRGEWVLDPFSGSFVTTEAALSTGRSSIGIDIDKKNVSAARKRIGAERLLLPVRKIKEGRTK